MAEDIEWLVIVPMTLRDDPIEQSATGVKVFAPSHTEALVRAEAVIEKNSSFDPEPWDIMYGMADIKAWTEVAQIENGLVF